MSPQPAHRGEYPPDWPDVSARVKDEAGGKCVRCGHAHAPLAGRTLTVHHLDGDKANLARWNLMPLCQACHLSVQARVDPEIPLMFPPSDWSIPYFLGLYEAGRSVPPPDYHPDAWIARYEIMVGPWPRWAESLKSRARKSD